MVDKFENNLSLKNMIPSDVSSYISIGIAKTSFKFKIIPT